MSNQNLSNPLALGLSPSRHVYLTPHPELGEVLSSEIAQKIQTFFEQDGATGLLRLGLASFPIPLPSSFAFWQKFAQAFLAEVCKTTGPDSKIRLPAPDTSDLQEKLNQAPFLLGAEYLNVFVLEELWHALGQALARELERFSGNLQAYLNAHAAHWNLVGRVCFHLAENKNDPDLPFAFLATYTTHLSSEARAQHLPLGRALQEYAGEKKGAALLALLIPVQKAAENSVLVKSLVDSHDIFRPLAWSASEAHLFLKDISLMESAGIVVRVPNWWNVKKPPRPTVAVSIGKKPTSTVGMDALLDFNLQFALSNGDVLSPQEWEAILAANESFIKVKGQWVEVDKEKLETVLAHWKNLERQVKHGGLSFAEGLRILAGASPGDRVNDTYLPEKTIEWSSVVAGDWLKTTLTALRHPEESLDKQLLPILEKYLKTILRPYQLAGVQWLWLLYNLKLGGCLADDMGLGKTIQILALLLLIQHKNSEKQCPHLLVVPASLLGNWQAEIAQFAPSIRVLVLHPSNNKYDETMNASQLEKVDVVMTTYSLTHRFKRLSEIDWHVLVLDEAQMIKNPSTKQTRAVKALKSSVRFSLTGTPIENRLSDLWSLFDFTTPGLLGSAQVFTHYAKKATKSMAEPGTNRFHASLRNLVSPYILRRLKTDKKVIGDLPDKTELQSFCTLSKQQVALYQHSVEELSSQLEHTEGIKRRGLVLAYLMRFKQICNHPAQWLGHGAYAESGSGKFLRLKEICEEIAARQEKALIFTQFREIIPPLADFLATLFGREGLVLHGDTPIKQRPVLVRAFQQEQGPPFFVLSLKAGGTGLNLTAAGHVIHFDRWWNPAVENQATDRAYRIGQKKNVLVHKFICRGTIEEKIDAMISAKKQLSHEVLEGGDEVALTELSNEELIQMISLDIHRALGES